MGRTLVGHTQVIRGVEVAALVEVRRSRSSPSHLGSQRPSSTRILRRNEIVALFLIASYLLNDR